MLECRSVRFNSQRGDHCSSDEGVPHELYSQRGDHCSSDEGVPHELYSQRGDQSVIYSNTILKVRPAANTIYYNIISIQQWF